MSPQKVEMTNEGVFYTFDYGSIPHNFLSTIFVEIIDEDRTASHLQVLSTCGCTVPTLNKKDNVYSTSITYDTTRKGRFHKQIQVPFKEKGVNKKIIFNIKGIVE